MSEKAGDPSRLSGLGLRVSGFGFRSEIEAFFSQLCAVPSTIILSTAVPSTPLAASFNQKCCDSFNSE